ncbi:hypothetical protein M569_13963, partial [Genlisea aurea]
MASSLLSPNPFVNPDRPSIRRKRKKKIDKESPNQAENLQSISATPWGSEVQRQIYSSKLLLALQQARLGASADRTPASKRVRDVADKVLAATARGRSRWSRAIISSRLKLKKLTKKNTSKRHPRKATAVITAASGRLANKSKVNVSRLKSKGLPAFQRKARLLARLVPGCRKQPFPVVLEETMDYIPALEMQVRAMSALVELLSPNES